MAGRVNYVTTAIWTRGVTLISYQEVAAAAQIIEGVARRTPVLESRQVNDALSAQVYFKGIQDSHRRLMVLMTHNTDIADTWEREGEFPREYFDLFSPRGYAIGVNVVLYAMTH